MKIYRLHEKIRFYHYALKVPGLVLVFCLLLTLASLWSSKRLHIGDLYGGMLPSHNESVKSLNYYKKYFGELGYLILAVEGGGRPTARVFARELTQRIEQLPTVYYVRSDADVDFFLERKWVFIDVEDLVSMEKRIDRALELQKKGVSFIFGDLMDFADRKNSPDLEFSDILEKHEKKWRVFANIKQPSSSSSKAKEDIILLWIKSKNPLKSIEDKKNFIQQVKDIERQLKVEKEYQPIKVGYTGSYQTGIDTVNLLRKNIKTISTVVSLFLVFLLLVYFKRMESVFLIGIPVVVGIIWTGGIAAIFFKQLNILTSFIASILAGLGSDYGIYLLARFYQERKTGKSFDECCLLAFGSTGKATYASMIVTVVAFLGLVFSDFSVLVEFGIFGAIGLVMTYLSTIIILPSLLALVYRHKPILSPAGNCSVEEKKGFYAKLFDRFLTPKRGWVTLFPFAVFVIAALFTLPRQTKIHFVRELSSIKTPSNELYRKVGSSVGSSLSPTVVIAKEPGQDEKLFDGLYHLLKDKSEKKVYNNVIGFFRFIPPQQEEKRKILGRIKEKYERIRLPMTQKRKDFISSLESSIASREITEKTLPPKVRLMFESPYEKGIFHAYLFPSVGRNTESEMVRYQEAIIGLKEKMNMDFYAADSSFLSADALKIIQKKAPRAFLFLVLFFMGVLFFVVRPFFHSFFIMLNLLGGMVILSGILWIFKIPINILNVGTIPIILGTGIDCFIHFNERFGETRSIKKTLYLELPPMSLACFTSIIGFAGLLLTSNAGLRSVGLVSVIGLGIMFLLSCFNFPRNILYSPVFSRAISLLKHER